VQKSEKIEKTPYQKPSIDLMNSFALTIELPPCNPVLIRQNGYRLAYTPHHKTNKTNDKPTDKPVIDTTKAVTSAVTETPEWPTGDESFYDNRATTYTWSDVVLTREDKRRAAFNEAVHLANLQRLRREAEVRAQASPSPEKDPSHVIQICDWV
jgi:hypothetical protein